MEFYDFESHIRPEIIENGRCLYQKGAVRYLQKNTDSCWEADILDGKTYEILLIFEHSDMKELRLFACDCEKQPLVFCSHITAALFYIRDGLKMMAEYEEDNSIDLQEFHRTENPGIEACKSIIRSALSKICDREGEIDYFHTPILVKILEKLYSKAKDCFKKDEFSGCIDIITAIYEEIIPIYDMIDDADFEIAGILSDAQWPLEKIGIFSFNNEDVDRVFYLILDAIDRADVDLLINLRLELLEIANILRNSEIMSKRLLDSINKIMRDYIHRDIMESTLKSVLFIKWKVLKALRRFKEANELFDENRDWPIFTMEALKRTFDIGDHQGVLDIVEESQNSAEKTKYSSYTVNWQAWKIKAYKSTNDIEKLRELYKRMLLEGDLSVYSDWNKTYCSREWPKERNGFLDSLWANFPLAEQLLEIFQRKEKLAELGHEALPDSYPSSPTVVMEEIIIFFFDYIGYLAEKAGNLEQYKDVVNEIRIFYTKSCHDRIYELIEALEQKYEDGEFVGLLKEFREEISG